jgi:hypothetical protein
MLLKEIENIYYEFGLNKKLKLGSSRYYMKCLIEDFIDNYDYMTKVEIIEYFNDREINRELGRDVFFDVISSLNTSCSLM